MRPLSAITILVLLFSLQTQAQPKVLKKIKKELNATVNSKEFATANIGFCLMDTQTGKVLVEYNSQKSFTPASAMKVVTTGAALALLGDTFRFKTELGYTGIIKNEVIQGDLIFIGYGDPTFGSKKWDTSGTTIPSIISILKSNNIKKVNGAVCIKQDIYRSTPIPGGYAIEDLPYAYGSPSYGFNYNDNLDYLHVDTILIPSMEDLSVYYDTIVYSSANMFIERSQLIKEDFEKQRYGDLQPGNTFIGKLYQYDANNSHLLNYDNYTYNHKLSPINQRMFENGSYITNINRLYTFYSPPLQDIATKTNQESINLYAEGILRALSTQQYGYSTLDTSLAIAQRFWKNEVGDLKGLRMTDGSGLSRSNLCTPLLFCKMLSAYTKRANFDSYYSTFAVAGQSGTVKNFATGTKAEGNAHIKTGTMSRVKSYIGYVTGNDGKLYSFALMFNNFEADAKPAAAATKIIALLPQLKTGKFFKVR